MAKKYNGGLKFGTAGKQGGGNTDAFPMHAGVAKGPLNSSPNKFDFSNILGSLGVGGDNKGGFGKDGLSPTDDPVGVSKEPTVEKSKTLMKNLPIGSEERHAEYEKRGWKHDETTKGAGRKPDKMDEMTKIPRAGESSYGVTEKPTTPEPGELKKAEVPEMADSKEKGGWFKRLTGKTF